MGFFEKDYSENIRGIIKVLQGDLSDYFVGTASREALDRLAFFCGLKRDDTEVIGIPNENLEVPLKQISFEDKHIKLHKNLIPKKCTCTSLDLASGGCKCGGT